MSDVFNTYRFMDPDRHVFRYECHWRSSYYKEAESYFKNYKFNNVTPVEIKNIDDAIAQAAKELGFKNPVSLYYYDETCGYWMVEMFDDIGYDISSPEFHYVLDSIAKTVVMDSQGITLEINGTQWLYLFIHPETQS